MTNLLAARLQMAMSLGFHILFAVAGMAMPLLMVLAELRYVRKGDRVALALAHKWAKGTAILFAVGAVSGTVLSFELGLLWPTFMRHAGPLIGMPFSLEGIAFFLEAIALGIYLYGWERVPRAVHLASGVVVAVSGLASGVFVVAVNAWMNTPSGFRVDEAGRYVDVDLVQAFLSPAFPSQALHMALASYVSVAFLVVGIHATRLLRRPDSALHAAAIRIALPIAVVLCPLQIASGDLAAKQLARYQPEKLAAAESLFRTQRGAPLAIGGLPDVDREELRYAIEIPKMLSVLGKASPDAEIKGLDAVPKADWPNVTLVHVSFQIMVASGFAMLALAGFALVLFVRKKKPWQDARFLKASVLTAPLGLVALEAGWIVTEVGRQPWIIRGVMRTRDAVTPVTGMAASFALFSLVYLGLGVVVLVLLARYVRASDAQDAHANANANANAFRGDGA